MDLNETSKQVINRHPWELSRTGCVMRVFAKYIDRLQTGEKGCRYINAGAGDLYFDKILLRKYRKDAVYAIDIAYRDRTSESRRVHKYHYLEEIQEKSFDYAIMMDSLEYMEDDVEYVRKITDKLKKGGYFLVTLPAYPILFSDYDVNIKNLRRYDRKTFAKVWEQIPGLRREEEYYFYTSLFMVRFVQKFLRLPIDPNHNFTANWKYSEKGLITGLLTVCLNIDFAMNKGLSRLGIYLPGLSMLTVLRKV